MTKRKNLNIILMITSLISFGFLVNQLLKIPSLLSVTTSKKIMILSIILIGSLIIGLILKMIFKKQRFNTFLFSLLTIFSIIAILYFFRPTYKIIVPENYIGEVNLILSNVKENQLLLDKNGIGYINKKTFNKTFNPAVYQNGKKISNRAIGSIPSTFWSKLITTTNDGKRIESLNFIIISGNKKDEKQNDSFDIAKSVDYKLVLTE